MLFIDCSITPNLLLPLSATCFHQDWKFVIWKNCNFILKNHYVAVTVSLKKKKRFLPDENDDELTSYIGSILFQVSWSVTSGWPVELTALAFGMNAPCCDPVECMLLIAPLIFFFSSSRHVVSAMTWCITVTPTSCVRPRPWGITSSLECTQTVRTLTSHHVHDARPHTTFGGIF